MTEKYEPVRTSDIFVRPLEGGELRVKGESQLDRIEEKLDSILEHLEGKELSISINGKEVAKTVITEIEKAQRIKRRRQ